jgi:hypothetical protein
MRKSMVLVAAFASLAVMLPTTVANASSPASVSIEIDTTLGPDGGSGPFTASGSAIDDGLFCNSGHSFDAFSLEAGQAQGINLQVKKVLVCDDGSGAVLVKLQVRVDRKGNNYSWTIVDGIGDYARLRGSGQGSGEFTTGTTLDDLLTGAMHVD